MSTKPRALLRILFLFALCPLAAAGAADARNGNLALCVGIDAYPHLAPLTHAVNDAFGLADAFEKTGDFRRVITLADRDRDGEPASPRLLPTRANILDLLRLVANNATHNDGLVFAFAGHGMLHEGRRYLMPLDAEPRAAVDPEAGIPLDEAIAIMETSRAARKLLLVDANHEGELFAGLSGPADVPDGFTAVVSTGEGQFSLLDAEKRRGLFSLGVEAALAGKADADGDAVFNGDELADFLATFMSDHCLDNMITAGQSPQLSGDADAALIQGYSETDAAEPEAETAETPAEAEPSYAAYLVEPVEEAAPAPSAVYVEPYAGGYTTSSGTVHYPPSSTRSGTTYSEPRQSSRSSGGSGGGNAGKSIARGLRRLVIGF